MKYNLNHESGVLSMASALHAYHRLAALLLLAVFTNVVALADKKPVSCVDACVGVGNSIHIKGWTYDPDYSSTSNSVLVYVYRTEACNELAIPVVSLMANKARPDVNTAFNITGQHGFDEYIPIEPGHYCVKVYAVDLGNDGNSLAGADLNEVDACFEGAGTSSQPFLIKSQEEWDVFVKCINTGVSADKCYKQNCSLNVTTPVGTSDHPFKGCFDGNNQTMWVQLNSDEKGTAPFRYADGATFDRVDVSGTVTSSAYHAAGLVGYTLGNVTIKNCHIAPVIDCSTYAGGIVGHGGNSTITVTNTLCGALIKNFTCYAGGLIGWGEDMTLNMDYCLFDGQFQPGTDGKYHPIACKYAVKTVNTHIVKTYFINTIYPSNGLGDNAIAGAEGQRVSKTMEGDYTIRVAPYYTLNSSVSYYVRPFTLNATGYAMLGDGEILTGSGGSITHIVIADGATVTLRDVWIAGIGSGCNWAGVTCEGNATIVLEGSNSLYAGNTNYPGISVPWGKTLTIRGTGSYSSYSRGKSSGIGGGYDTDCGNIVIEGGTIDVSAGTGCAGIGGGNGHRCGNITITGGTVNAKGGQNAAAIGGGNGGSCGNITIASTATKVTATKYSDASSYSIGAGNGGTCGTVSIEGVVTGAIPHKTIKCPFNFEGAGTSSSPYLIKSYDDWNQLGMAVSYGIKADKYYQQTASLNQMSGMIGTEEHPFAGTYDGANNELSVSISNSDNVTAPFRYVSNATIKNLKVLGSVSSSGYMAGGIVGMAQNTVNIINCCSSVGIYIRNENGGAHGGIIGCLSHGTTNITGCLFNGRFSGTNAEPCGGFVGMMSDGATLNITNSLFAPSQISSTGGGNFVFAYDDVSDHLHLYNSYYTTAFGAAQGKQARTVTLSDGISLTETRSTYSASSITTIGSEALSYGGTVYSGSGMRLHLSSGTGTPSLGYAVVYSVNGTLFNSGVVIMPDANATISLSASEVWGTNAGADGSQAHPYVITSTAGLDLLAQLVNNGTSNFAGKYFRLDADLAYNPAELFIDNDGDGTYDSNYVPIGNSDRSKSFCGYFDGGNHTISGIRIFRGGTSEDIDSYQGLFGRIGFVGTYSTIKPEVKNVILADADITGYWYVGGIAGHCYESYIKNCHVTSTVRFRAVQRSYYYGGIAGEATGYLNVGSEITNCSSAATFVNGGSSQIRMFGGITGASRSCNTRQNVALGVTIPTCENSYHGAVAGTYTTSTVRLSQNYYVNSTVAGRTTNVGAYNADLQTNFGALPGYSVTVAENVTSSATVISIPAHKDLNTARTAMVNVAAVTYTLAAPGETITLGYNGAYADYGIIAGYTVKDASNNTVAVTEDNGMYSFTMPSSNVTITPIFRQLAGSGTSDAPYTISNAPEWTAFVSNIAKGVNADKCYRLTADVAVSLMAGDATHNFSGTFDGDGHTLTVNLNGTDPNVSPFCTINGATIKNLKVAGTVSGGMHSSGLVGGVKGGTNLIEGCEVAVAITTSGTHSGGFVGHAGANAVTLRGCVFSGSISGTGSGTATNCGTLFGWSDNGSTPTVVNCLDKSESTHPIGRGKGTVTVTNTYYTKSGKVNATAAYSGWNWSDDKMGSQALVLTLGSGISLAGTTVTYRGSNLTLIDDVTMYDGQKVYGKGGVTLTLSSVVPDGKKVYYLLDGQPVIGNTIVTPTANATVTSVLRDVNVIDLAFLGTDVTATDGQIVTGTLAAKHKISIADNAQVTLRDVNIVVSNADSNYDPTITCLGDATIVLEGTNHIDGYSTQAAAIDVFEHTLVIDGTGSLEVNGQMQSPAIGTARSKTAPGTTAIRILGGTITAVGGAYAAAIGGGPLAVPVDISIAHTANVTAVKGADAPYSIGRGYFPEGSQNVVCGAVSFDDVEMGPMAASPFHYPYQFEGFGAKDYPYLISSDLDWSFFTIMVNNGNRPDAEYYRLTSDIETTRMAGTETAPFKGTFDGDGHNIKVDYTTASQYAAPFRYVDGATIKNLVVGGDITTSQKYAAGFVGYSTGNTTITNSSSMVNIHSSVVGEGSHGGFMANISTGAVSIEGCVFTGKINGDGTTNCAGFVGWTKADATLNIINSAVLLPNNAQNGLYEYTFARASDLHAVTISNSYSGQPIGVKQGKYTLGIKLAEGISLVGTETTYNVSNLTAIGTTAMLFSGILCGGEGEVITLSYNVPEGKAVHFLVNGEAISGNSFVMPTQDVTVTAVLGDANIIDLALVADDITVEDQQIVTGTLAAKHKIQIAPGATVFLDRAIIALDGSNTTTNAAITCLGNANIMLMGANSIASYSYGAPAISAARGYTLTIGGNGSLNVSGQSGAPAIGPQQSDGLETTTIIISGGVIEATGGENAAAIGTGPDAQPVNIRINGGTVTAQGGAYAAAIGGGKTSHHGAINIYNQSAVHAQKGEGAPYSIGRGYFGFDNVPTDARSLVAFDGVTTGPIAISPFDFPYQLTGAGTSDSPFIIDSSLDWAFMAVRYANGTDAGEYYQLTRDIAVSNMVGNDQAFSGIFDGDGHTLTVSLSGSAYNVAPFSRINGATIKNLKVDGTVSGAMHCSGLVGGVSGGPNLIENCEVAATITTSGTHCAGFLGHGGYSSSTFRGCVFSGDILGGTNCGIFVGWGEGDSSPTLIDCFDISGSEHPIGRGNGTVTVTNTYYVYSRKVNSVGNSWDSWNWSADKLGKLARTVNLGDGISLVGTETSYDVSGLTAIGTSALRLGNNVYSGQGETLTLSYGGEVAAGNVLHYTVNGDHLSGNTYTMADVTVDIAALVLNADLVNLDWVDADITVTDGQILAGTLAKNHKISIADDATVTLRDVSINNDGVSHDDSPWAGITCLGDAVIMLEGSNVVKGICQHYPAIQAGPEGTTLTISGGGSLVATGMSEAPAIGPCYEGTCGNIVIQGGYITALKGSMASSCIAGNGTVTVGGVVGNVLDNFTYAGLLDSRPYMFTEPTEVSRATYFKTLADNRVGRHQPWFVPFDYTITADDLDKFNFYKINMIANAPTPGEGGTAGEMWVFLTTVGEGTVLHGNRPYVYKPKTAVTNYPFVTEEATMKAPDSDVVLDTRTTTDIYSFYGTYQNTKPAADGNPFYYVNINGSMSLGTQANLTMGPYRWIMRKESKFGGSGDDAYAREISFFDGEDGTMTVIDGVAVQTPIPDAWYTLDGRKLDTTPTTKGVYIYQGRKVVVR